MTIRGVLSEYVLPSVKGTQGRLSLLAFAFTLACAIVLKWEAEDLIWCLWASSLTVGGAYGLILILWQPASSGGPAQTRLSKSAFAIAAFFVVHFGIFHYGHGMFLDALFPLDDDENYVSGMFTYPADVFRSYWLFVVASFISWAPALYSATRPSDDQHRLIRPYLNVVRMHLLIFVFLFGAGIGLLRVAVYPILLFYFFPIGQFLPLLKRLYYRIESRLKAIESADDPET